MLKPIRLHLCLPSSYFLYYAYGSGVVLTNPSCSNSSLSLCFGYGGTMPITGYDVSKSGCCPSSEEGFDAKTGFDAIFIPSLRQGLFPFSLILFSCAKAYRSTEVIHELPPTKAKVGVKVKLSKTITKFE